MPRLKDPSEMTSPEYIRDLAERIFMIPVMYGVDQGDVDRLAEIAAELELAGR